MSQVLLHDLQLLWENSYSEQGVLQLLRKEIPDDLIQESINIIEGFMPQYDTQWVRWDKLRDQDLFSLCTDLWVYLCQLDGITLTAVVAQVKYLIKDDPLPKVKTMGEILFLFAEADLINLYKGVEDQWTVSVDFQYDRATQNKIDRIKYMPPMLVQPKPIRNWKDNGYLTLKDSGIILNNYMKNDGHYCLNNLNHFNQQPLHLNVDFLTRCQKDIPEDPQLARFLKETWEVATDIIHTGNTFYMNHKYDKRGRQYAQGYHINPQGDGYHKAMIDGNNLEKLTSDGLYWLKVDIANQYGLDKLPTFDLRVEWVDAHLHELEELVDDVKDKNKPLYLKAVYALRDAQAGLPIAHLAGLDAVFSGGQLWGVLTNCRTTCETIGLLGDICIDPYIQLGTYLKGDFVRDDLKYSIMPYFYGSSRKPEETFGEEIEQFLELMETKLPGAADGRDLLIGAWNPDALEHRFTLPDGFEVILPSMEKVAHRITCLDGSSFTHVIKENMPIKHSVSLAANVIQAFDGYIVREMRRRIPAHITLLTNHDCFKVHPNYVGLLNSTYCSILADLAASDALQNVFDQLGIDAKIEHDDELIYAIRHAKYALA